MEPQVFGAGTIPGSPTTAAEIKTLICLLLTDLKQEVTFEQLHEILLEERLVNYFELVQNLDQLTESGHILKTMDDTLEVFRVTELGEKTARELYTSLPKSVRDRTISAGRKIMARHQRLREVHVEIQEMADGYQVDLAIPDTGTDLLALSLFVPSREEAERVRIRFLNDPIFLYRSISALLHGDYSMLGALPAEEDALF